MKISTKTYLIFFLLNSLLIAKKVESQNLAYGTTFNLGLSKITSDLPNSGEYKNKFAFSGNVGGFMEKRLGNNSVGVEFLWVQIKSKEELRNRELIQIIDQEIVSTGIIDDVQRSNISYLGIPVFYRFQKGKFGLKLAMQSMVFLYATSKYKAEGQTFGEPYETESKTKNVKYNRFDFGPKIGIDFKINNSLRLRTDFYYGLTDITLENRFLFKRKNRQISLGINYLISKEEN